MALDLAAIRAELDKRKEEKKEFSKGESDRADIPFYSLPDGTEKVLLRFGPPLAHERLPGRIIRTHWGVGADNAKVHCYRNYGLDCPMCELLKEYEPRIETSDWSPAAKAYFNVWVLSDPSYESRYEKKLNPKQVHLLGASDFNYEWLLDNILNPEVGDVTDPLNGSNVTFEREKKKGKFKRTVSRGSSPVSTNTEEMKTMLEGMYDMAKIWKNPDDTYHAKMKDAVAYTRDVLENKILTLSTETVEEPKDETSKSNQTTAKTSKETVKSAPTNSSNAATVLNTQSNTSKKPAGAPDCFSMKEKFEDKDYYNNKCVLCAHEYQCKEAIGG
jgi:hypothetical protein